MKPKFTGAALKASPFAVAAVAVLLVLIASYFVYNDSGDEPPKMDIEGDWVMSSYIVGYYSDGEPVYEEVNDLEGYPETIVTVTEMEDGTYKLVTDGLEYACVANNDILLTTGLWDHTVRNVLIERNGVLTISSFDMDVLGVVITNFERPDQKDSQPSGGPAPIPPGKQDIPFKPVAGEVYEAFIANQYTGHGLVDHLSDNYSLTIVRAEPEILFYNSHSDSIDLDFVSFKVSQNDWISICDFNGTITLIDMMHCENGVFYTMSYDNVSGSKELWQVCYGDPSKAVRTDLDIVGCVYEGYSTVCVQKDGQIVEQFDSDVAIEINGIDYSTNTMEMTLIAGGITNMGSMVFKVGPEYRFYVESLFVYEGDTFWGYYVGTLSEDCKRLLLIGEADSNYGTTMVFTNVLELTE